MRYNSKCKAESLNKKKEGKKMKTFVTKNGELLAVPVLTITDIEYYILEDRKCAPANTEYSISW